MDLRDLSLRAACVLTALCARAAPQEVRLEANPTATPAVDATREGLAFVEVLGSERSVFEHEVVELRLQVGIESAFLGRGLVQLFAQPLDVPVQVEAAWLADLPGTRSLPRPAPSGDGARATLALGDRIESAARAADRVVDGRTYRVLEIERAFVAVRAGVWTIPAPRLRLARATRFQEDFLSGAVPVDWQLLTVDGAPATLRVKELPREGRPTDFVDAVGRFTLRAETAATEVEVGERFALTLVVAGEGNFEALGAPRLRDFAAFEVFDGHVEQRTRTGCRFTYDLAATEATQRGIPAIALSYFDPSAGRYATASSESLPLRVRGAARKARDEPASQPGESGATGTLQRVLVGAALVVVLIALLALKQRRLRRRSERAEHEARAASLERMRAAVEALARSDADLSPAFIEVVAARLGCAPGAVVGRDLGTRLRAQGLTDDLAGRTVRAIDALMASRFGGQATSLDRAELLALAGDLERSLGAR
jgi:hypothetical protein